MNTTTPDIFTSPLADAGNALRDGYAKVGDVELHYVEAGHGPLVVLLRRVRGVGRSRLRSSFVMATQRRPAGPAVADHGELPGGVVRLRDPPSGWPSRRAPGTPVCGDQVPEATPQLAWWSSVGLVVRRSAPLPSGWAR